MIRPQLASCPAIAVFVRFEQAIAFANNLACSFVSAAHGTAVVFVTVF